MSHTNHVFSHVSSAVFTTGSAQEVVEINFMREDFYHVRDAHLLAIERVVTDRSRGADIAAYAVPRSHLAHDGLWPLRYGTEELFDFCQPPHLSYLRQFQSASRPSASDDHAWWDAADPHGCSSHCRSRRPCHSVS